MLVLIVVGLGVLFSVIFHIGVKEKVKTDDAVTNNGLSESSTLLTIEKSALARLTMSWKCWLKESQFYQV